MKGEEIKMLNNVANFLGAWRNSEPLEKLVEKLFSDQFSLLRSTEHSSKNF